LFLSEGAIKTLVKHQRIQGFLIEKLKPEKKDVIIIGSSNKNKMGAEFAARMRHKLL
jgi:hypothetical protein